MEKEAAAAIIASQRDFFWSGVTHSIHHRRAMLDMLELAVKAREADILEALRRDLGKCATEAYASEVGFLYSEIRHARRHLRSWMRPRRIGMPWYAWPARSRVSSEPYGCCLIIAPWNYPFQLALAPVVAAVAAGNTVVLKPSELAPATAAVLESLVNDHFTPDCFAVATGGPELSQAFIAARPDHIFYTGSTRVGRIIMREAAERLIPVVLELGGKSPCLVLADADIEVAARRIVWGKFMNCGQTCVAPDYVLVEKPAKDRLVAALTKAIADFYAGGTTDPAETARRIRENPEYGRIINDSHFKRLALCIEGQRLLAGGAMDEGDRFIAPTLIDEPAWDSHVMSDEIFGPVLPIISFEDLADTLDIVRDRPVPLAFYVFSGNVRMARRIMGSLRFGGGCVNDTIMHLANSDLPFGGAGDSGMGDYHGRAGFEAFTHRVSVVENPTVIDPALRYPPYGDRLKFFRKLF